jgi:4-hydroxybenzoate polyprenyltransferase
MIKFSHSIFALPFAFSGMALAAGVAPVGKGTVLWVVVAMVGARSAAMGFNRLADRKIDAANPRTASRELPRGVISPAAVTLFIVASSALLVYSAWRLNPLCFSLSPVALLIVFFYSYTKRFTWATQCFLGLSLAVAPIGAWIAATGSLSPGVLLLGGAVLTWVAGFDTIYACQDIDFDRSHNVYSLPQRFGIPGALRIARVLHGTTIIFMAAVGVAFDLGPIYGFGVAVIAAILIYEHRIVSPDDLMRVTLAFQNLNAVVSTLYFAVTLGDLLWPI